MFWILMGILFRMGPFCSGNKGTKVPLGSLLEGAIDEQPKVAPRVTSFGSYTLLLQEKPMVSLHVISLREINRLSD